jgi:aldehyde:ferredoxin oxidoreductase
MMADADERRTMDIPGKKIEVDLSTGEKRIEPFPEEWIRMYLAGRGINSFLIHRDIGKEVDPLSPSNVIVFSGGLLTGTDAPASSRLHVSARSPLTGGLGSSNVGGMFGAQLANAGFQTVVVRGMAERPSYLFLHDGRCDVLNAEFLWGKDTWETQSILKSHLEDESLEMMAIGPAGEGLVRYASILTGRGHAAGRTGMGAVLGSKNLKAIVVKKESKRRKTNPAARDAVNRYHQKILAAPRYPLFSKLSNTFLISWANEMGILATRNYQKSTFEGAAQIDGRNMIDYVVKHKSCTRCPVHCKAEFRIPEGRFAGMTGERPDLEPIIALGAKCGVDDPQAILHLYNLCSRLGVDVLTMGSVLAFSMEAYEKGILTPEDTEGIELTWGNDRAMEEMIHRIVRRQGLGKVLGEGVQKAAESIGRGAEQFAYHSKGLELTGYDPRGLMATALGYAVSTRGGDFTSVYALPEFKWDARRGKEEFGTEKAVDRLAVEGKGLLVKRSILASAILDSLGICKVPALSLIGDFDLKNEAELTSLLTGWEVRPEELFRIGERVFNLENLFNIRHGKGAEKDTIPEMFRKTPLADGVVRGAKVNMEPMLRDFYDAMGWDSGGRPSREKLEELGLWEMARKDLE